MRLEIFKNKSFEIRAIQKNKEILFDATFVCKSLSYSKDTSSVLSRLDDDEKVLIDRKDFDTTLKGESKGGAQSKWFVNEYGLYNLILGSQKESAKQFKRWITHEIIPQLRKTGSYSTGLNEKSIYQLEKIFSRSKKLAQSVGLRGRAAILKADELTKECTGISSLELLGVNYSDDTKQINLYDCIIDLYETRPELFGASNKHIGYFDEENNRLILHKRKLRRILKRDGIFFGPLELAKLEEEEKGKDGVVWFLGKSIRAIVINLDK